MIPANNPIVRWKDTQDLARGFEINLEHCSVKQLIQTIYKTPQELINAFSDCFLLMRYEPEEAEEMAYSLYMQTRASVTQLLKHHIDTPFVQIPANAAIQH